MTQVMAKGTGRRALVDGHQTAGKTGTTSDYRDAWFIGFTGDYVAGVWMGNDDNSPLTGVTGGGLPADIWHEVMTRVEEGLPDTPLPVITPDQMPPPEYPGQTYSAGDPVFNGGGQPPIPGQQQPQQRDQADDVLTDVLRKIFGRRN
jgi:penicillin-binding protein 1A